MENIVRDDRKQPRATGVSPGGIALYERERRRELRGPQPGRILDWTQNSQVLAGVAILIDLDGDQEVYLFEGGELRYPKLPNLRENTKLGQAILGKEASKHPIEYTGPNNNSCHVTIIQIVAAKDAVKFVENYLATHK